MRSDSVSNFFNFELWDMSIANGAAKFQGLHCTTDELWMCFCILFRFLVKLFPLIINCTFVYYDSLY